MLPVTQVTPLAAKAFEGGMTPRFDAALLEAAKMMRDSAPQAPEMVLVPKVRQAVENALAELSQKPLDQLKAMAEMPQAARSEIAAIVSHAAQAAGLNADETAVLKDLVPLALPRVLAYKVGIQIPGATSAVNANNGGVQPGPQGRTPVKAVSPAEMFPGPQADARPTTPEPQRTPANDAAGQDTASQLASYAQTLPVPVLVSTRTDDGSGSHSVLSNVNENAPAQGQPQAVPAQGVPPTPMAGRGRVIQVSTAQAPVSGSKPQQAIAPASLPPVAPDPVTAKSPADPGVKAVPKTALPVDAAIEAAVKPNAAEEPTVRTQTAGPRAQAPKREGSSQAPVAEAKNAETIPAKADLDVQFQDPSKPIAIVPGSELTLKEDGTWALPVSNGDEPAPSEALKSALPKAVVTADASPAPSAPAQAEALPLQATAVQAPAAAQAAPKASVPSAPQVAFKAPAVQQTASNAPAAPQTVAKNVGQTVPFVSAQAEANVTPAPSTALEPQSDARQTGSVSKPSAVDAFEAAVASNAVQPKRTAGDSAFQSLGQFGQDPMKTLAQMTARDYSVRESVFKQVTEALREAPSTDQGRMMIRLKPVELGEVHIDLVMLNGKLNARLVASHNDVRDAFVRDLPAFKAGLESQGVVVRDISVAVRADVGGQPQGQPQSRQQAPQSWWRELPQAEQAPLLFPVLNQGYGNGAGAIDQRFSAFA